MGLLNLKDVHEGMVTNRPIMTDDRKIVGEGVVITQKILHVCKMWGVVEVDVCENGIVRGEQTISSILSDAVIQDIKNEVSFRFGHVAEDDEIRQEILRIALKKQMHIREKQEMQSKGMSYE